MVEKVERCSIVIDLHGYKFSVYAWIARFALHEKGVKYNWIEVNPFADDVDPAYLAKHPFCRVPTLVDGRFVLYETSAITRYIDEAFDGPKLQPADIKDRARVNQVISIVDSYVYWPLVRQVFSHDVMGPRVGRPFESAEVRRGLESSARSLAALEQLLDDRGFFMGASLTLADIHLAPMLSYFNESDKGREVFQGYGLLQSWFGKVSQRKAFLDTKPVLPAPFSQ